MSSVLQQLIHKELSNVFITFALTALIVILCKNGYDSVVQWYRSVELRFSHLFRVKRKFNVHCMDCDEIKEVEFQCVECQEKEEEDDCSSCSSSSSNHSELSSRSMEKINLDSNE